MEKVSILYKKKKLTKKMYKNIKINKLHYFQKLKTKYLKMLC